jgi:hypothetical protein
VEQRRDAEALQLRPQRVVPPVVGLERLDGRVELEAADAVLLDQPAAARMPAAPRAGSIDPNGMSTSGCSEAAWAISSLDRVGCPVASSESTVKTTAAIFCAR